MTTKHDIVSIIISNDSSRIIIVEMVDDEQCVVTQYSTENFSKKYEVILEGEYVKAKCVV